MTAFGNPAHLLIFSVRFFLCGLAVLVAFHLLNGAIATRRLLKDRETGAVSALRLQMLIATAIAAVGYAAAIRQQTTGNFPPMDARLIALIGGSNGLVLIKPALSKLGKVLRTKAQV